MTPFSVALERGDYELAALRLLLGVVHALDRLQATGEATERLLATLGDRLRRVWCVRRVSVDATGLGSPIADPLAARLPRGVVEPLVFSAERKSRLGFALLAAVLTGRLRLYGLDGSAEATQCLRQLKLTRVACRDARTMQFDVDPAEGHNDYLISLALCVDAASRGATVRRAAECRRRRSQDRASGDSRLDRAAPAARGRPAGADAAGRVPPRRRLRPDRRLPDVPATALPLRRRRRRTHDAERGARRRDSPTATRWRRRRR
ncbi:MAG TPA: hypothetical protein QGI71_08705 [Dehalococcoidia bacterium]|jgi:hypothetical protein|nr:hypothetical protein [Dehalococcoidia bacterium]